MNPLIVNDRGHGRTGPALALVLLTVLVLGVIYLYQHRNVPVGDMVDSIADESKDAATTTKVKTALALSKRVSVFDIGIDTNDGIVVMTGEVPSPEVRDLAEEIVSGTGGVDGVENRLLVNDEVTADPERTQIRARVDDLELRARVAEQLAEGDAGNVEVEALNGVVTLTGEVDESSEKYRAELIALNVGGVQEVRNELQMATMESRASATHDVLAKNVELSLYRSKALDMERVVVDAQDGGLVRLTGTVRSLAEKLLAERLAEEVAGVTSVLNELRISGRAGDSQT